MADNISKHHGEVSPCTCGTYSAKDGSVNPERTGQRACNICFGRGFVAECTRCGGQGQIVENMAGGPGTMKSTCIACGGIGKFAVNKPKDWIDDAPEEKNEEPVEELATATD
jgi:hypothetical protein